MKLWQRRCGDAVFFGPFLLIFGYVIYKASWLIFIVLPFTWIIGLLWWLEVRDEARKAQED